MEEYDQTYDPDCDVSRFLYFEDPKPISLPNDNEMLFSPPTPPRSSAIIVRSYPVHSGVYGEKVQNAKLESFLIAALERLRCEGSASSEENTLQAVFQQVAPNQLNCSTCTILREVLHCNETRKLSFVVHGELGRFDHAVFDHDQFGDPSKRELYFVDLSTRSHEWVKSFITVCINLMKSDPMGHYQDSLASFYDTLYPDINLTAQQAPGMYFEAPEFFTDPNNYEVGESSETRDEGHDDLGPTFQLSELSSADPHVPRYLELIQYQSPVNPSATMPPTNFAQSSGPISPIIVSDSDNDGLRMTDAAEDGRTPLAKQRRRTARMRVPELMEYLHLPINDTAKKLRMCTTALKNICRRNGMERWPSRQIQAIDRQIERLEREMVSSNRIGSILKYKEEIQALRLKKYKIYQSVLDLMNKPA